MKKLRAFTLVELMVVMAIISFLSVGAYAGLTFALRQGRDTQRRRIVDQIQTALIAYYSDFSGYPGCGGQADGSFTQGSSFTNPGGSVPSGYVYCANAFAKDGSLLSNDAPAGLVDYFEGDFKWGPISDVSESVDNEMRYYYSQKSDKSARSFTVCARLENTRDDCYCVGAEQSEISCASMPLLTD